MLQNQISGTAAKSDILGVTVENLNTLVNCVGVIPESSFFFFFFGLLSWKYG